MRPTASVALRAMPPVARELRSQRALAPLWRSGSFKFKAQQPSIGRPHALPNIHLRKTCLAVPPKTAPSPDALNAERIATAQSA